MMPLESDTLQWSEMAHNIARKGSRPLSIIRETPDDDWSGESRDSFFEVQGISEKFSDEKTLGLDLLINDKREIPVSETDSDGNTMVQRSAPTRRHAVAPLYHPVLELSTTNPSLDLQYSRQNAQIEDVSNTPLTPESFVTLHRGPILQKSEVDLTKRYTQNVDENVHDNADDNQNHLGDILPLEGIHDVTCHDNFHDQKDTINATSESYPNTKEAGGRSASNNENVYRTVSHDNRCVCRLHSYVSEQFEDAESEKCRCDFGNNAAIRDFSEYPNVHTDPKQGNTSLDLETSDNEEANCNSNDKNNNRDNHILSPKLCSPKMLRSFETFTVSPKTSEESMNGECYLDSNPSSPDWRETIISPSQIEPPDQLACSESQMDHEQLKWREKVKKSVSFTSLSDTLGPLRRSKSSEEEYGRKQSTPNLFSDMYRNTINNANSPSDKGRKWSYQEQPSVQNIDIFKRRFSLNREHRVIKFGQFDKPTAIPSHSFPMSNLSSTVLVPSATFLSTDSSSMSSLPVRRISAVDQSDLTTLKATANRLNLTTRRPSTVKWRERYLDSQEFLSRLRKNSSTQDSDDTHVKPTNVTLTSDLKSKIEDSLAWLKQELISIRRQDQSLARQFLGIRHTMNKMRLAAECQEHRELLNDAEEDMEELRELSRLVDIPPELLSPYGQLKHLGITPMNINSRRFSTC